MVEEKVTKYSLEYLGVKCTGVSWKDNGVNVFFFTKDGKDYRFLQVEKVHCNSETDYIRLVIEYLFLPWLRIERIKELEAENAELKARLEKAKNALQMACEEMAILGICCQGCENEENCMIKFLDGGYKMKANECEKYWSSKAEARLAELKGGQ